MIEARDVVNKKAKNESSSSESFLNSGAQSVKVRSHSEEP